MNVLLLGSGGREHALAWKLSQSKQLETLYIAPGNAGTAQVGTNVSISPTDFDAIKTFVLEHNIKMVVVGPEDPLVAGIYDYFKNDATLAHITVIGPSKQGAQLEGSKDFAKAFMAKYNIPTAKYMTVTADNVDEGRRFLYTLSAPYVLKADGLAAGKGVLILNDIHQAITSLGEMLDGKFGSASQKVVIEEYLSGIECSVFVLTDGKHYHILPEAKDYKRIGEGDTGLNTGGMGAVSPVWFANEEFMEKVKTEIVEPTITGLQCEHIDYKGFIFIGLMNVGGNPKVIEYNVRMGDPETEVVMPRIQSDLLSLFVAVGNQSLNDEQIEIDPRFATTVMMVSGGYPEEYAKGKVITGTELIDKSLVFHAGTTLSDQHIITNGGRVLSITSYGNTLQEALDTSYKSIDRISFENSYFRKDIGKDLLIHE